MPKRRFTSASLHDSRGRTEGIGAHAASRIAAGAYLALSQASCAMKT
jgi:hypothetical protein